MAKSKKKKHPRPTHPTQVVEQSKKRKVTPRAFKPHRDAK